MFKRVLKKVRRRVRKFFGGRASTRSRVAALEAKVEGLAVHLPTLLNLIPTLRAAIRQQALSRAEPPADPLAAQLPALLNLVPALRAVTQAQARLEGELAELRAELAARLDAPLAASRPTVAPRIVDVAKVERLRGLGLKLNLGCGHRPLAGYVNVDLRELPGVDIVAAADAIPLVPGAVEEIAAAHLIERFPQEELERAVLPHWRALLRDGGTLRLVASDADAMTQGFAERSYPFADLREALYGGLDRDGELHRNVFTPESCAELLAAAGFVDARVIERGRRNGRRLEFELVARKAAAMPAALAS